jgi:hypothetical protein
MKKLFSGILFFVLSAFIFNSGCDSKPSSIKAKPMDEYLFVITAPEATYDQTNNTLRLKNIDPAIVYFSDRPNRTCGHTRTTEFFNLWKEKGNPPNASISYKISPEKRLKTAVVKLINPKEEGNDLIFEIQILHGKLPESFITVSLFVDGLESLNEWQPW